jgi:mRNA-degrading endonuclease RelE of RelBE toxin-antitoxin system
MNWAVELSTSAIKELKKLPRDRQAQIERAIDDMESDPLAGDVIPLKGNKWKGRYRKRVGPYRIIFALRYLANSCHFGVVLPIWDLP